jgi:hypothetical protein
MMFDTDMAMMFDTSTWYKGINWNWNCMTKVYRWYINVIWWLWKHYDDDGEAYKVYPMRRNVGLKSAACIIGSK